MSDAILERVIAQAERLPFLVLVGWVEQLADGKVALGGAGPYSEESVHFRHDPALAFHSRDISDAQLVTLPDGRRRAQLQTTFLGLTGASSPLPSMLLEGLARDDDDELLRRDFLDVFHHRLLSLLYRGLLKFDLPRSVQQRSDARALDWLLLLGGLPPAHAERVVGLPRHLLLRFAPLLVTYPANAERLATALRCALEDLLGEADVHIAQMQGGYVEIDEGSRARLGVDLRLRRNSTLGSRAPAPASGIVAQIAPLSPASCARLAPGGDRFELLCAVALLFCPETVQIAVELTPTHTPPSRLGFPSCSLGRSAWLGGRGRPLPVRFGIEPNRTRKESHAS
jgi:type VI secretion system protein ImpH